MTKKWFALLLVAGMLLASTGLAVAAQEGDGSPPFELPKKQEDRTEAEGNEEKVEKDKNGDVGRETAEEKQNGDEPGPPAFVKEMQQKGIHVMERARLLVNGHPLEEKDLEFPPVIKEGRTLVPVRAISNALGADDVEWDDDERRVIITKGDVVIKLYVDPDEDDKLIFKVSEDEGETFENYELDVSAQIFQGRTFVPIRFVAAALGEEVGYCQLTRVVSIGEKEINGEKAAAAAAAEEEEEEE